ncbi:MAG TPA: hypothetical protein VF406_14000 [Thermodesulfobacteriota bacterium]
MSARELSQVEGLDVAVQALDAFGVPAEVIADLRAKVAQLGQVLAIAGETVEDWHNWRGMASTFQAADDSMWRLRRALRRAGLDVGPRRDTLWWRGALIQEVNAAGFYRGADDLLRHDPSGDRILGDAVGPTLREVVLLAGLPVPPPRRLGRCTRCGVRLTAALGHEPATDRPYCGGAIEWGAMV